MEKTIEEVLAKAEEHFNLCPFCEGKSEIRRLIPATPIGIYAQCMTCGAVAGIGTMRTLSDPESRLYSYWSDREDAPDLNELEAENLTLEEMHQLIKERPEILQLLKSYDSLPESRKPEAYNIIMTMLQPIQINFAQ